MANLSINFSSQGNPGLGFLRLCSLLVIGTLLGVIQNSDPVFSQDPQDKWLSNMRQINPNLGGTFEIDARKVEVAGIQVISGKHLDLYTDVRDAERTAELVEVFNRSVNQWCDYFGVDVARTENWKMRAFLIADAKNPDRFRKAGLMPADLPEFRAGFQRQHDLWLYLQPGNYYTRHLLIHEGTHGFMQWYMGGYGAPWYSEGIAELFGVHRWQDSALELRYRLRDRSEADYWGRVKRIKDDRADGNSMSLTDVLNIPPAAFLDVRYYAWSWAGCEFFENHELSSRAFAKLNQMAAIDPTAFNLQFVNEIQKDWDQLQRDWELFLGEIEYGYEVQRGRLTPAKPIGARFGASDTQFEIRSDHSWQGTTLKVKKGDRLKISGRGEFQVGVSKQTSANRSGKTQEPWPCQSNGITIEYYRGHPLGMLHAGILAPQAPLPVEQISELLDPIPVGSGTEILASRDGILCLRINESPAKLDDNSGVLEVTVEKLK